MSNTSAYVEWFRGAAPYIKAHRKKTFVIMVSDNVIFSDRFIGLVHDIALLNHLGIKLVLLHGSRHHIDANLRKHQLEGQYHNNIRITDDIALPIVLQAINQVRTHFESHLSMGLPNTPMSGSEISLVSGNFVTGMPLGVIDGVDMKHSGKVRDIKYQQIAELIDQNHVVLLSNLGYSRTGEVFNLPAEELAVKVASRLNADKLVYLHGEPVAEEQLPDTLSPRECETLCASDELPGAIRQLLEHSLQAIRGGVKRAHLIDLETDGGLLLELFTRDGYGTMVTNLFYEGMRDAVIDDIGGILNLIKPLEKSGVLVPRSREQLELEIEHFMVIEKDGMIIACIACLLNQAPEIAEIACLAVHDDYRKGGLGQQLLELAERKARRNRASKLYTLTTQTSHWFLEQGYREDAGFELPTDKQDRLNPARGSKILTKAL